MDDLTCIVGKNESGKTVFMRALSKLNPSYESGEFDPFDEFPRHRWPEYKQRHDDDPAPVTSVRFDLEEEEKEQIESEYGTLESDEVTVTKNFANELHWDVPLEDDNQADGVGAEILEDRLPEFRYVGEYAIMDGTIDVDALAERYEEGTIDAADRVFLSFLSVAGLDLAELEDADDWRDMRTELEAASGALTSSVAEYWSQTDELDIRIEQAEADGRTLSVRVENLDHDVTVEFEKRSRGFRWFFSTFCQLNELQESDDDVVLLLDEPGLNLHPKAKRDFLQYLESEFAPSQTLFYTAHSPFMIDSERIHRTKMIQKTSEHGSTILSDAADADEYTRFPLKNAFELDLMDTLLSRSRVLLVQSRAVHTYLYGISELMEGAEANGLNPRWTVLPVDTIENVPTFLGMFESYDLDAAVLFEGGADRETSGRLPDEVSVRNVGEYASVSGGATIEDLLSTPFYLDLVSRAYADSLANTAGVPDRLTDEYFDGETGDGPIVERLTAFFEEHRVTEDGFDREVPAAYFREHRGEFTDELDLDTKRSFGALVRAFDDILDSVTHTSRSDRSFVDVLLGR